MKNNLETGLAIFIALTFVLLFFIPQTPVLESLTSLGSRTEVETSPLSEFKSEEFNFSFKYPGDSKGYVIDREEPIGGEALLLIISPTTARQLSLKSTESFMIVRVYDNISTNIDQWASEVPEVRYNQKINGHQYGRISGRDAVWFQTRDNIGSDNLIIKHNNQMIVFTSVYPLFNQSIRDDLVTIMENLEF